MTWLLTALGVVLTSILSGVFGMAGGVLLFWLLISLLSVPVAMTLHGVIQFAANGYRFWLLREYVYLPALPPYLLGLVIALGAMLMLQFLPDRAWVLIIVGLVPLVAEVLRPLARLRIEHRPTAVVCGLLCTAIQLGGVSGPLLDVFFAHSDLNRHQVVATKALTQTLAHVARVGYWLYFTQQVVIDSVPVWIVPVLVACAVVGTTIGRKGLDVIGDWRFARYTRIILLCISAICLTQGFLLLGQSA